MGSLGAANRGAREAGDDRVGDARSEREIGVVSGSARGARRVATDSAQRPASGSADLDGPAGLERLLELLALRVPWAGFGVRECRKRVRDAGELPRAADSPAGLLARVLDRPPATLPELRDVTLTPRAPLTACG